LNCAPGIPTPRSAAREWQRGAEEGFLKGYDEAIGDCPSPPEPAVARRLIDLFLLEKALYEIAYEAVHRPGWIGIPLGGLARVLGAAS
jgi:maltose alpha-D-glucosyltransferase / alpha-amylase